MKKIDLHGNRHDDVERLVENFVLLNSEELPIEIITGNSDKIRKIVIEVLDKHYMKYHYKFYWNMGSIVVMDY